MVKTSKLKNKNKGKKPFYNSEIPDNWASKEFGDVFSFLRTFSFSRDQLTSDITKEEIYNIHYGDIHTKFENEILDFDIEKTVSFLNDGLLFNNNFKDEDNYLLKDGDLIIADASEDYKGICDCVELKNVRNNKIISGLHTFAARAKQEEIVLGFRTYVLSHEQVVKETRRVANGTSVFAVSKSNLARIKIALPPLAEQVKIASCLSLWDKAININKQLIAHKETNRKWLMNNLLLGRKRLNSFSEKKGFHKTDFGLKVPKDWSIENIGKIFTERNETSSDQKRNPLYSLTIENGLTEKTERYERSFLLKDQENNQYKVVYPKDILFNPMNLRFGAIAKSEINFKVLVSAYYSVIRNSSEKFCIDYFIKLFKTQIYNSFYERIAIGSLMEKKRVHTSNFLKLQVPIPSIEEQKAIASVIITIEKEIMLLREKSERMEKQKNGIMQNLLTGKLRFNI